MSVQFFGQFLIEQGEIDADQLRDALAVMEERNLPLGALAVREGWLSAEDAERINHEQRRTDRRFGEIAVELGLLAPKQVDRLVHAQEKRRIRIGEALVSVGHVPAERLGELLDRFKRTQAPHEGKNAVVPPSLQGVRAAEVVLDLVPRLFLRVAHMQAKLSVGDGARAPASGGIVVSLALQGRGGLHVALVCGQDLAEQLAPGVANLPPDALEPELVPDALAEFLNVVAGNALAVLEREGSVLRLSPPSIQGGDERGEPIEIVTPYGSAWLVLSPL